MDADSHDSDDVARNLAIAQRGWDAFTAEPITAEYIMRGGLEPVLDVFDRGIVWDVTAVGLPGPDTYYGHRGVRQFWVDWFEAFDGVQAELLSLEGIGDKVVSAGRQSGRGAGSGTAATMDFACVFTIRDAKVVRMEMYADLDEARRAARLDPAAEPAEAT